MKKVLAISAVTAEALRDGDYQGENREPSLDGKQKTWFFAKHSSRETMPNVSAGMAVASLICATILVGCASHRVSDDNADKAALHNRIVMYQASVKHQEKINQLQSLGVNLYQLGDKIMLVVSTDNLFVTSSPAYTQNFYHVMDAVAKFIAPYNKVSIKVAGYSDNLGNPERNLALSRARARKVASYLWEHGVDARLIYSAGYGSQAPIASNKTDSGRYMNRRIEITLQQISS